MNFCRTFTLRKIFNFQKSYLYNLKIINIPILII